MPGLWVPVALVLAAAVLLGAGALVGLGLLDGEGTWADQWILEWVQARRTGAVAELARAVTMLLDLIGWLVITVLLVGVSWWRTRRADLPLLVVVTIAGGQVLGSVMKMLVDRPRPGDGLVYTSTSAFPSGHSSRAMVCALVVAWLLVAGGQRLSRRILAAAAILLALAVGASRVVLHVHWPTDVLGGLVVGGLWFGAVLVILRPVAASQHRERPD